MTILVEETRSGSRDMHQSRNTGETEAVRETGTEITQTGGKIQVKGLGVEATSEREMFRTSVSSKRRGSSIMRKDESIDRITRAAVWTRIQNTGNLIINQKIKL